MNRLLAATMLTAALLAGARAEARPFLMLAADNTGFRALDLGDIHLEGVETSQITLIDAPLAGAPFGEKLAAIKKQRLEFECQGPRWRLLSTAYTDAQEQPLGDEVEASGWRPVGSDAVLAAARDAACLHRYPLAQVSRNLNLGDIVTNYHNAWGPAAAEPLTHAQQVKKQFDASH